MDTLTAILSGAQLLEYALKIIMWVKNRFRWRKISTKSREIAFAFHSYSWHYLQQSVPAISTIGTIERLEIRQILDAWDTNNEPILLRGEGGTGKSGIALRVAQKLANEGVPVLIIRAIDLPKSLDPALVIQQRLPFGTTLGDAFSKLAKERTFALIVDQLDTVSGTELCKGLVSLINSATGIPNIKILAVSRAYEAEHDSDISNLHFRTLHSGSLSPDEARYYLSLLGLNDPSENIVKLAENLLELSLMADVIGLQHNNLQDVDERVDLWEKYFQTIQQKEGEDVAAFVLNLARDKTIKGERSFSVQLPYRASIRALLSRGILFEVAGKRLAFKHEYLQDYLCAYSIFPEQPTAMQLVEVFGSKMPRSVISWIHLLYSSNNPDMEAIFVKSVLAAKDGLAFYTRASILENLRAQTLPSQHVAGALAEILTDSSYARYFFDNLENSAWISPLYYAKVFYTPPEPYETKPGYFSIQPWKAGEYLSRYAQNFEDIVLDVAKNLKTDNWHAHEVMIDCLIKISPGIAVQAISSVDTWITTPFSRMLPIKLGLLCDCLKESGFTEPVIQILEYVIKPILRPNLDINLPNNDFQPPLVFRSEHHWVNEFLKTRLPELSKLDPIKVTDVFERQLGNAIDLVSIFKGSDAETYVGYYWRFDIPFSASDGAQRDVLNILIDGLRDVLVNVCESYPDHGHKLLLSYLSGNHLIFKRLAIFTLRLYGQRYVDILENVLGNREYLENQFFHADYNGLMKYQFENSPPDVRAKVIDWILEGPLDVDARALRHAKWDNRDVDDADKQLIIERWGLEHLSLVSQHLSENPKSILDNLVVKYGEVDIEERHRISTSVSWGGAPSPVSADELAKMSFDELVEVMAAYNEPGDSFLDPGESLAEVFGSVVQNNPVKYRDFAYRLTDSRLRFVYLYRFLNGISEAIKNGKEKLTDAIVTLCESVVRENEEQSKRPSSRDEPNLLACQLEIGRLVENAVRSDDPYLTGNILTRLKAMLFILSEHSDPKVDPETSSLDPFTQSLNSVRGVAMHGIMQYLLYVDRQRKKIEPQEVHKPIIESDVQRVLQNKLDITRDPSLAVHSVFGAYLPQLQYLDRNWLRQNIEKIFPESSNLSNYWHAAWDSYIFNSNVYGDVFQLLVHHYQRALVDLAVPAKDRNKGSLPSERLAQHIMFVYFNELTDFGHENKLLDLFFTNAPDQIRSSAVFWLSKVLESRKPSRDDELWKRLWRLWQARVKFAVISERPNDFREEISNYMRWLTNTPMDLGFLKDILQQSIKFLNDGYSIQLMASFAAKHCESYPLEAVGLIFEAIKSATEPWWSPEVKDEETILRVAMASGNSNAKDVAVELINYRGEQGDFRWKKLLE